MQGGESRNLRKGTVPPVSYPPLSPFPFSPPISPISFSFPPSFPLEVGPLKPARESAQRSPGRSPGWKQILCTLRAVSHWRELFARTVRANNSREQFARTRIHTDASDRVARQNTLTSFLTFITDSVYRFIVFIDLVMLFRRKSHRLDLDMLKRSKRWSFLLLSCRRFGERKRKFVPDINKAKQSKTKLKNGVRQSLCAYQMCIT